MGLRFKGQEFGECFFITTTFKHWKKLGDMPGFLAALTQSLEFCCRKYETRIIGYVLMPSHVHLLLFIDGNQLSNLMRDFKKYTSQKVARDFGITGGIWQPRYDRVVICSEDILRTKLEYIHNNPVKSGLVRRPGDWKWSSASDYIADTMGPLPVWKNWM